MTTEPFNAAGRRAVFLDRDGTLIVEKDYLSKPEEVALYPGVGDALRKLKDAGFLLVMVTNQSGVGRGYFSMADVERVHEQLSADLTTFGVRLDQIYVAPEAPEVPSRGRKPSPQFLLDAKAEFGLDLGRSFMVGDKLSDLECGWRAGVAGVLLVRTGYGRGTELKLREASGTAVVVDDLGAAAEWILKRTGKDT